MQSQQGVERYHMSRPGVSICLPVFNGEQFLAESIESVLAQSYEDFELLISDDCSTDNSAEICRSYAAKDSRIRFSSSHANVGVFSNYNECLRRATGTYIKPFAQDDLLSPAMLSKAVAIMRSNPSVSLLAVGRRWIDERGHDVSHAVVGPKTSEFIPTDCTVPGRVAIRRSLASVQNFVGEPVAVMFRGADAGAGFDDRLRHIGDWEYWLRLLLLGEFYVESDLLCSFRIHSNSRTIANCLELHTATDFIKFVRNSGWLLDEVGVSRGAFVEAAIESTAHGISDAWQCRFSEVSGRENSQPPAVSREEQVMLETIRDLREVALHSLRMLGERSAEELPQHKKEEAIGVLEQKVSRLLSSKSWRYTKVFRDINTRLGGNNEKLGQVYGAVFDDTLPETDRQKAYIRYLRKVITTVRTSRSWRISAPIRALKP